MASPSASAPGTWPNDATCVEERNQTWPSGSNNNNVISSGDDGDGAGPSVKRFRTRAQELFEEKREARRRRREMKDSGDWLGVQGVNPLTGELDVITPTVTTSSSSRDRRTGNSGGSATAAGGGKGMSSRGSSGSRQGLEDLARAELRARADYAAARARHRGELRADNSRREEAKLEMLERVKSVVRADQLQAVKWRRGERQWSSVAEPTLSPIAGSLQSSAVFGHTRGTHPVTDDDEASRAREPSTNVQQQLLSLLAGNAAESTDTVVRHELIDSGVQYVGLGAQELHSNGLRFSGVDEKGKAKVRDADFAVGQAGEAQTAHNPTRVKEGILAVRPREITCPNPKPRRSPTVESTLTSPGKMTSVFVPSEPAKESFPLRARQTLIGLAKDENPLSYAGKATETVAEEESRDKPAADAAVAIKTVAPVRVGHHAIPKRRAVSLNAALRAQTHIQGWADPLGIVQKSLIPRPVQVTKPEGVNPTNSISRWNSLPLHKSLKPAKKLSPDVTNGVSPADKQTKSVKITLPSGTRGEAPLPSLQMPSDGPPEWASRLTEELSEPGMARRNGSGSAFTPTTTTTGSVGRGRNFPGPSSALPMPSPRTATMASRQQPSGSCFAEASVTRPQANAGTTAGSSQPVVTPSSSPSTDRRHETPGTDTMSSDAASHQVNPMKLRTKVPSPQASTRTAPTAYTAAQHTSTCTSAAAAAEESRSTPPTSQQPPRLQTSLIPAAFRTPSFSNSNPAPSLSQAIAQGAAQVAVVQSLKLVDAPTPPPRMSTPMSQSPSETEQQTSQRRQTKTKSQKRDLLEEEEHSGTGLEKHRPLRLSSLAMYKRSTAKGGRQLAIAAKLLQVKPDKTTSSTSSKEPSNSSSNSSGSDTTGNVVIVAPFRTSSRLPSPRCVDGGASDKSLGPNDGPSPTAPSDPMPYSPLTVVTLNNGGNIGNGSLPRLVLTLIIAATTLVWREAAPVFDATSDVRRRAALRQSTWRDVFAYLLASSLVFAALVGTAWAVRLGGLVAGLLAEVFDGIRWLLGM